MGVVDWGANMIPVSPIIPGHETNEVIYAKDQPEYIPLPALRVDKDCILTRWRLTWRERLRVLWTGDLYLYVLTFGKPLQPLKPSVSPNMRKGSN